ncbi:helix-turn-helix transcriptional regulator [Candidatus Albibeggiatoa sp. nov. NOAA]|uniref:helix-turn-helix domain-containing protein n=1 Tax=Candidatus Albibeggiatoa sp. nov. NOAA TaxID=3162724 RepID=UPI0032F6D1BD|nr:helix-turn-helix transcriptional regulator [Thiotrichaceae bacterium]
MSDLQEYITKRKSNDAIFADGFDEGYEDFKIGVMLKQIREEAGMTQLEVAEKLGTKKSAISRIENHAQDIRLSTLEKYAAVFGKRLAISIQ